MATWPAPDEKKLAELLLYVAGKIEQDPTGGATKVNKILFFAETSHVRAYGVPITGGPYRRLPQGPAPTRLVQIRRDLIENGQAEMRTDQYFGYPLHRLVPLRAADTSIFARSELETTDQVIESLWGMPADEASRESHEEMGYMLAGDREEIPLYTAVLARETNRVSDSARKRANELARESHK